MRRNQRDYATEGVVRQRQSSYGAERGFVEGVPLPRLVKWLALISMLALGNTVAGISSPSRTNERRDQEP
jgi:hypothetical protein